MRFFLCIMLFLQVPFCYGQSVIDSIINTEWIDEFGWKLNFNNDTLIIHGYGIGKAHVDINDSIIDWYYFSDQVNHQMRYEHYADSLILYTADYIFPWSKECYTQVGTARWKNAKKWTYYNQNYLRTHPFQFVKMQISNWKRGFLEMDSSGNIFYKTKHYKGLYGHYRGKLKPNQLDTLLRLIEEEQPEIRWLSCTGSFSSRSHSSPPEIKYITTSKTLTSRHYLDDLQNRGYKVFALINSLDPEQLEFQNYADGDSVDGVLIYQLRYERDAVFQTRPVFLGSYEDKEGKLHYLYKGFIDSVYYSENNSLANPNYYLHELIYFHSDTLIENGEDILLEAESINKPWFEVGRAFQKPVGINFWQILSYKEFPKNYKLVVRNGYRPNIAVRSVRWSNSIYDKENLTGLFPDPFPKPYNTVWGIPYPFLRPPHQVAFEEFILPDWKAYLSRAKILKN